MRIAMVTRELAPYSTKPEARAAADLAGALASLGHEVHAVALLPTGLDTETRGLARRLRPLTAGGPGGETSWHRFDGLTPEGIQAHLLAPAAPGGDRDPLRGLPQAAVELARSLGPGTTWCCSWGPGCAPVAVAGATGSGPAERVLRHLLVLSEAGEWSADLATAVEAYERIVLLGGTAADGWRSRSPVFGRLLGEGRLAAFPTPAPKLAALSRADKAGRKATLQLRHGLPVRPDLPLIACTGQAAETPGLLARILSQDVQVAVPRAAAGPLSPLAERYPDRLLLAGAGPTEDDLLAAADIALIADDPAGAVRAMSRGAVPVAPPDVAEGVVDLAPDLSSGSGAIAGSAEPEAMLEALGRAVGAFRRGPAFAALAERIQGYPPTWPAIAARFAMLMAEPVSDPGDSTPARPSTAP